jgi:formate dehydrogenase major subunit/formate dehydrogenase alpha subunit
MIGQLKLTINGIEVKANRGVTVLEAAQTAGIYIPYLCHDPDLEPTGDCRICLVEIEGMAELVTACTTPATDGMMVHTDTSKVNEARRAALEPILAEHPSECLICDRRERCQPFDICLRNVAVTDRCVLCPRNYHCELQKVVDYLGDIKLPVYPKTRSRTVDYSNPFFKIDRNYCILCRKCVRACNEVTAVHAIEITQNGDREQVSSVNSDLLFESICKSCGECMIRCPVGALMPKDTRQPTREVKTTCPYCGVGCQMYLGIKDEQVIGLARGDRDNAVNTGRLCVKGRFGATEFIHHPDRLTNPLVRQGGKFTETTWDAALDGVATRLSQYQPNEVAIISSAKCTNEENYLLQKLGRAVLGTHNIDHCARL